MMVIMQRRGCVYQTRLLLYHAKRCRCHIVVQCRWWTCTSLRWWDHSSLTLASPTPSVVVLRSVITLLSFLMSASFFLKSSLILSQKCPFSDFISMAIVILMSARMTVMLIFMSTALPLCLCQKQLTVIYWIHLMGHRDNHPTRRFLQAKEHKKCSFGWIRDAAFCPAVIWSVIPVWTGYKNIWWQIYKKKTRNNITFGGKSANLVSGFYELKKSSKRLCKGFYRWIKGSNNRKETVVLSKSWK